MILRASDFLMGWPIILTHLIGSKNYIICTNKVLLYSLNIVKILKFYYP